MSRCGPLTGLRAQYPLVCLVIAGLATATLSLQGQSLSVLSVETDDYPILRAQCYVVGDDGALITDLSPDDWSITEDNTFHAATQCSTAPTATRTPLSVILGLDLSRSMDGTRLAMLQAAADALTEVMKPGPSQCVVLGMYPQPVLHQDLTTDHSLLEQAVTRLASSGTGWSSQSLLGVSSAVLGVSKRAAYRKVIILIVDGLPVAPLSEADIIAEAQQQNAAVHAVVLGTPVPDALAEICARTGGSSTGSISTEESLRATCHRILLTEAGVVPWTVEWESTGCSRSRELQCVVDGVDAKDGWSLTIAPSSFPTLEFTSDAQLAFGEVQPGATKTKKITITAKYEQVRIDAVTSTHSRFTISDYGGSAPPFTLGPNETRTLSIEYAPEDSSYVVCMIDVSGNACEGARIYADAGWDDQAGKGIPIRVVSPNGEEVLRSGDLVPLTWEGVMPGDSIRLEYSTDGGASWMYITDAAHALHYAWCVPASAGTRCLLRATAKAEPTFIGDMALIPAGSFRMGNVSDYQPDFGDETPVHTVTITKAFLLGRTEVTQAQYEAVMGTNPSEFKHEQRPVETLSWLDAIAFCNELSRQEGLTPCYSGSNLDIVCDFDATGYRLPTEAEWEYAARAGTATDLYSGNLTFPGFMPRDPALEAAGWYGGSLPTHVVGQKVPNAFGLYDMHGNVQEFCWDQYESEYYVASPAIDPRGPDTGYNRIARGGNFMTPSETCRSSARLNASPADTSVYHTIGFRIARKP